MSKLRQGNRIANSRVVMSCTEDGQRIATPVPHQLHPGSCLLNAEPKLTDCRGDLEHPGIGQGFYDADYKACIGPAETSCVVCILAGTHLNDVSVQLVLGHIHRSQMYDTDNRRILGQHNITRKVGKPWYLCTGSVMVADLIEVYGRTAVGVGMFYGYQCPMCVGVFVLGASEEGDSDVNIRMRLNMVQTLRVHINWWGRDNGDEGQRGGVGREGDLRNGRTQSSSESEMLSRRVGSPILFS